VNDIYEDREDRVEVRVYQVSLRCDQGDCGGYMVWADNRLTHTVAEYPRRYRHRCTVCDYEDELETTYPHEEHRHVYVSPRPKKTD
jgi:hypothetical protein